MSWINMYLRNMQLPLTPRIDTFTVDNTVNMDPGFKPGPTVGELPNEPKIVDPTLDIGKGTTNGSHVETRRTNGTTGHTASHYDLDVLIVGAGMAGCYMMHRLRAEGFTNIKIVEAGSAAGGVWYWNSYPGARVDTAYPVYQIGVPECYKTWDWKEKYPSHLELKAYFKHVEQTLDLAKDTLYDHTVVSAAFDESSNRWNIKCNNGTTISAALFITCIGFAAKRHYPDWPGLQDFKGTLCHSSYWPQDLRLEGKRVGVVGTGATGIQLSQQVAREAEHLTCFVRTPNLAFPMQQCQVGSKNAQRESDESLDYLLRDKRYTTGAGFLFPTPTKNMFEDSPEEITRVLDATYDIGGFLPAATYIDITTDPKAGDFAYEHWQKRTARRMKNPVKRDLLVPKVKPHLWAGKRPSLEQDYYEQMDKDHVTLVDVKNNPVERVTAEGVVTADGQLHALDVLTVATGFDSVTGGYLNMDITGRNGEKLGDHWAESLTTNFGMSVHGFPNWFFTYGPQAPSAYSNGPSILEPQIEWIINVTKKMRAEGATRIEPTRKAELAWRDQVNYVHTFLASDKVDSWWNGANVPGKRREPLNYGGGNPNYLKQIDESLAKGLPEFVIS